MQGLCSAGRPVAIASPRSQVACSLLRCPFPVGGRELCHTEGLTLPAPLGPSSNPNGWAGAAHPGAALGPRLPQRATGHESLLQRPALLSPLETSVFSC